MPAAQTASPLTAIHAHSLAPRNHHLRTCRSSTTQVSTPELSEQAGSCVHVHKTIISNIPRCLTID